MVVPINQNLTLKNIVAESSYDPTSDYNSYYGIDEQDLTPRWVQWASMAEKISSYVSEGVLIGKEMASETVSSMKDSALAEIGNEIVQDTITSVKESKPVKFSNSVIGQAALNAGKGVLGNTVGSMIGEALPNETIAYQVGKSVARKVVGESPNKDMIVQGAGFFAGLTMYALTQSLTYLTGTPLEYGRALGFMVKASGTIAGGISGLEAMGQEVPNDFAFRTFSYLAAAGAVGSIASTLRSLPLPGIVSKVISVGAEVLNPVISTAAYYGPETVALANKAIHHKPDPNSPKLSDPGNLLLEIAKKSTGSPGSLAIMQARGFVGSPTVTQAKNYVDSPMVQSLIKLLMQYTVNNNLATNSFVRAVNSFVNAIQENGNGILQKINAVKDDPSDDKKEDLKKELTKLIEKDYGFFEQTIVRGIRSQLNVPDISKKIVDIISDKETTLFGFRLSENNDAQIKALLEVILPVLIPFITVSTKREMTAFTTKPLESSEIIAFYQNVNNALWAPFSNYKIVSGVQGLFSMLIPFIQSKNFIFQPVVKIAVGSLVPNSIEPLDDDLLFVNLEKVSESEKAESKKPAPRFFKWSLMRRRIKNFINRSANSIISFFKDINATGSR